MKNAKTKINNATRNIFLGSVMKESRNFLPLTNREKTMIKWFSKFQLIVILVIISWIYPIMAIQAHLSDYNALRSQASETEEIKWEEPAELEKRVSEDRFEAYEIVSESVREISAYNVGDPYQTDDSPCIGAYSKVNLCEEVKNGVGVCAGNFVPLGTELLIEAENGWSFHCIVWDRMNSRYKNRVDIAMSLEEKERALKFGIQNLTVKILKKNNL